MKWWHQDISIINVLGRKHDGRTVGVHCDDVQVKFQRHEVNEGKTFLITKTVKQQSISCNTVLHLVVEGSGSNKWHLDHVVELKSETDKKDRLDRMVSGVSQGLKMKQVMSPMMSVEDMLNDMLDDTSKEEDENRSDIDDNSITTLERWLGNQR